MLRKSCNQFILTPDQMTPMNWYIDTSVDWFLNNSLLADIS